MTGQPDVRTACVQLRKPNGDIDVGQVTYGYYIVEGDVLTMTDCDGFPVKDESGQTFTHTLLPDDNPEAIGCHLTRKVRQALRKETPVQERFRQKIVYPRTGVA